MGALDGVSLEGIGLRGYVRRVQEDLWGHWMVYHWRELDYGDMYVVLFRIGGVWLDDVSLEGMGLWGCTTSCSGTHVLGGIEEAMGGNWIGKIVQCEQ